MLLVLGKPKGLDDALEVLDGAVLARQTGLWLDGQHLAPDYHVGQFGLSGVQLAHHVGMGFYEVGEGASLVECLVG